MDLRLKFPSAGKTLLEGLRSARNFVDPRRPGYLIVYVTNRCNFACDFCFYHAEIRKGVRPDELSVKEFERIARSVGGLLQLSLTGGEPFVRLDFADVANVWLQHTSPHYVTIPTNGWFTDRIVDTLERILPAFPNSSFRLMLSIDGIGGAHDEARSAPGSYDRLVRTFNKVAALRSKHGNLVLDANTVLTERTRTGILDTLRHLDTSFDFDNLSVTCARGGLKDPGMKTRAAEEYMGARSFLVGRARRRENRSLSSVWRAIDDVTYDRYISTVFDDKFVGPCVAGSKLAVLRETGEVFPCEILGPTVGNVRDFAYDLPAVLAGEANRRMLQRIRSSRCRCGFECALAANLVWNVGSYPKLARAAIRNLIGTRSRKNLDTMQGPPANPPSSERS